MPERGLPHGDVGISILPSLLPPSLYCGVGGKLRDHTEEEAGSGNTRVVPPESLLRDQDRLLRFDNIIDARLFRQYVHRVSSWIDVCDRQCNFGIEVPRRAHRFPLLSYGIMAFASAVTVSPDRGAAYHNQAVDILIPILDGPIESLDENVLAAIVLLRAFEEGTDTDAGTHLFGSARLLNTASGFAAAGGLGEAASWIVLRQSIYISFTRSQPLCINLDNYRRSSAFTTVDAESLANRAVFLCAQVLAFAFGTGESVPEWHVDEWESLDENLEEWYRSRPKEICAFWVNMPRPEEEGGAWPVFPTAWMIRPAHVVGMQVYFMARLLLAIFNPRLKEPSFEAVLRRRQAEVIIIPVLRACLPGPPKPATNYGETN
ncbi:putative zn 2cys6 transcription factor [Rosellinia necatrix]|uniref:Putative zn 2cys6 transcription factor n=1 Tax=Rosellinia necatrix TaxID=77044 RepID=A0A1W2TV56_ROSNE|nr:putative zn 2cys6 transcription factor [Rosellinia necatrix]